MVKFDRETVISYIIFNRDAMPIRIKGILINGREFETAAGIRTIHGIDFVSPVITDEGDVSYDNTIVFNWNSVNGATGYHLEVGTEPGKNDVLDSDAGNIFKKELINLERGKRYYGRVRAIVDIEGKKVKGYSDWSDTSDGISILYEQDGNVTVAKNVIYPENGDEVSFNYKLDKTQKVSIEIYNINGDLVKVLIDKETRIPGEYTEKWDGKSISGYVVASGLYLVKIQIGGKTEVKKVLVIK